MDARGKHLVADVELIFDWNPTPRLRWGIRGAPLPFTIASIGGDEPELERLHVERPPEGSVLQPDYDITEHTLHLPDLTIGDADDLDEVRAHILNLWPPLEAGFGQRPIVWAFGPWSIGIEPSSDVATQELKSWLGRTRLYAPTHVMRITRSDHERFDWQDVDEILDRLYALLAFLNGALVGIALPVGYRAGVAVFAAYETTNCDRGGYHFSWTDGQHFAAQSAELVSSAWDTALDTSDFGWPVLARVIRMAIESNHLSPIDVTHPISQAALELVAFTVLVHRSGWLNRKAYLDLDADARIRLLCGWAGIPTAIPPELTAALAHARSRSLAPFDGPRLITDVRNDIIHPPKRAEWPDQEAQTETWRIAQTYLELVLLRVFGYQGAYASRYHLDGRRTGTVQDVPWAQQAPAPRST